MKLLGIGRYIIGAAGFLASFEAHAQSATSFEAASIRRNMSGSVNTHIGISGGRLTIENASVKTLIRNAFDIQSFQLAGEPRWIDTEMYDIAATTGSEDAISPERYRVLLQTLLAERFGFRMHWETREASEYMLVPAKGGSKLRLSSESGKPSINTRKGATEARMEGARAPVSLLAGNLGNQLSRIVVDKTGLTGLFDWTLEWNPSITSNAALPSLFTALQNQLGLKLEAGKGPMQVVIIDHVERASEN